MEEVAWREVGGGEQRARGQFGEESGYIRTGHLSLLTGILNVNKFFRTKR